MEAVNLTWEWHMRWGSAALLLLILFWYGRGWRHGRSAISHSPHPIRPALFGIGLLLLALVWLSPLYFLATQLFVARTVQRILLIGLIPFFLLLSNPAPILFAGLPLRWQNAIQGWEHGRPRFWQFLHSASKPSVIWLLFVCTVWLWYDPQLHNLTLRYPWLHNVETAVLLAVALLYWWHILAVAPHLHTPMHPVIRILYAVIGSGPVKFVGFVLLFSAQPVYNYPAAIQFDGLHINDQGLAGILIWTVGGVVYTWTAVYLARQWMALDDDKPYLPHTYWSTEEAMLAPGFSKKTETVQPKRNGRLPKEMPTMQEHLPHV
ncbi:MAG TPA: cytochrome c oxidase assembly protein [Chloroflexota bacterium]|nr:cytochrome c oxidase assembly protein [Chloroflexota bacterium]HUM67483.1 cytochrome c oxidase assembly protein [Chloroflexota bacterium]